MRTAWLLVALAQLAPPLAALAEQAPPARPAREAAAFSLAEGRRAWAFPADHGQHTRFKLEWWYYTGILSGPRGERFGFQVTFFRRGLTPLPPARESAWGARSLFAAQAALTLIDGPAAPRFFHGGASARESLGMAGAAQDVHRVWVRAWRADPLPGDPHGAALDVPAEEFALALKLSSGRGPVLHGEDGLDRKGERADQASWYYSQPRLDTTGTVTVQGRTVPVRGVTWMDHEFSSGQLGPDQLGWDWFGLRLSDGSDLMLYRLRRGDGSIDPFSGGTWIASGGEPQPFAWGEGTDAAPELLPIAHWRSPATGARYPVAWRVRLPARQLELEVRPLAEAQELMPTPGIPFPYWEGAVRVSGTHAGRPLTGEGYLELTGYGGDVASSLR